LKVISGTPTFSVSIYTEGKTYTLNSKIGDPNSDILSIETNKDLLNPSGSWSISFVPKEDNLGLTWFDKIDVFSYIEIKFKGISDKSDKLVMRGIVDSVDKAESYAGGIPSRNITISGRDLGALLTDIHLYWLPEVDNERAMLKMLSWDEAKNALYEMSAQQVFDVFSTHWKESVDITVGNEKIQIGDKISVRAECFGTKGVSTFCHLFGYQGPWWNLFTEYQDKPFNELFLYDGEDFCYFILRPTRYKDAAGSYHKRVRELESDKIMYPPDFEINDWEKISMAVTKSDSEIYSYYITIPKVDMLAKDSIRSRGLISAGSPERSVNPYLAMNKDLPSFINKYGFRPMEASTIFHNLDIGQYKSRGKSYENVIRTMIKDESIDAMNETMVAWFLHNPLLLAGSMTIRGTNGAIVGTYLKDRDDMMEYYVEGVSHSFVVLQSYTTTLKLTRGQPQSAIGGLAMKQPDKSKLLNRFYFK